MGGSNKLAWGKIDKASFREAAERGNVRAANELATMEAEESYVHFGSHVMNTSSVDGFKVYDIDKPKE